MTIYMNDEKLIFRIAPAVEVLDVDYTAQLFKIKNIQTNKPVKIIPFTAVKYVDYTV